MFPDEDACLDYIFRRKYPDLRGYHRISTRIAYVNNKSHQIYPLKGTIFEKSRTLLTSWFYAMYLFHTSKNGVAAKELERQLGVTYKCAWRMAMKIRELMAQDTYKLFGIIEADETYVGGRRRSSNRFRDKTVVVGAVQRKGPIRVRKLEDRGEGQIIPFVEKAIRKRATLYTDEAPVYNIAQGYKRGTVKHSAYEFVRGKVHTNTIEGFWGQFKRSLNGTFHSVSKQHLQAYLDEFAFRYNHRSSSFSEMLKRI
jgi:transposase